MSRPLLLGHRGARAVEAIPENTIASFDRALADGCDGFEFDVRLTCDGQAVICHDPKFEKIEVARSTAKQLQLPQFREILERYRDSFLDIELKVKGLEKITLDLFLRLKPHRGFVVSSFLPGVLKSLHAEDATIPLGFICDAKNQLRLWNELPVKYVIPRHDLAEPELIRRVKGSGKKLLVWTVNQASDMQRFGELGVDGIISDETSLLCKTLSS